MSKKRINNIIVAMLMLLVIFIVAGCGAKKAPATPEDSVKAVLTAISKGDTETLDKYYDGDKSLFSKEEFAKSFEEQELSFAEAQSASALYEKIMDFDSEIIDVSTEGDMSVVTTRLSMYDFGNAIKAAFSEIFSNVSIEDMLSAAFSGEEDYMENLIDEDEATKKLVDEISKLNDKSVKTEIKINVHKDENGTWKVQDFADDFSDAIEDNMSSAFEEIASSLFDMSSFMDGE